MFRNKYNIRHRLSVLLLMLALNLPLIFSCANNSKDFTPTSGPTTTLAATSTPASVYSFLPTPTQAGPVNIGAVNSWSGPVAMAGTLADQVIAVVEEQVKEMGGILGGRPVDVIRYDDRGTVAEAVAGFRKLTLENKVAAIVFGGASGAVAAASSDAAEEYKVPYFDYTPYPSDLTERPYTVRSSYSRMVLLDETVSFVLNTMKPATVALLDDDDAEHRERTHEVLRKKLEKAGVKVVYEQYVPAGTLDFSPFLTEIKYENPDLVIAAHSSTEFFMTTFKQIMELGGWGKIEYLSMSAASTSPSVLKLSGAKGTYHWVLWINGFPFSGAQKFEQDFKRIEGRSPDSTHVFSYLTLWTAIKAIELAGTDSDTQKIAQAARSGQLQWDSPAGPLLVGQDGETNLKGYWVKVNEEGKAVPLAF